MAFDPDTALTSIREDAHRLIQDGDNAEPHPDWNTTYALAERILELDEWMSDGKDAPYAWSQRSH